MKKCPHCKEGKPRFVKWWFVDVDAYLVCDSCGARLGHINFVYTAVLYAVWFAIFYLLLQRWGIFPHGVAAMRVAAVLLFALPYIFMIFSRLGLLRLRWWMRHDSK